jgi:hypothetical protein
MTQTVLPFKLHTTTDTLTAHAGLVLLGEYCEALGLREKLNSQLPGAKSGIGYAPADYIYTLILMLHGGGRSLADLRILREDKGLQALLNIGVFPSESAFGDWLVRHGNGEGLAGLANVQRELLALALSADNRKEYTLDIDATQIVAHKYTAEYTYKGEKGYMPMTGHIAENGWLVGDEFRAGNIAPAADNLGFIRYCEQQLPAGKHFSALRADSAAYQAEIFNHCEDNKQVYAIGAKQDASVQKAIAAIPENAWSVYRDREIAETVHCMENTKKAFRLIVTRKPKQQDLFEESAEKYFYHTIASNRTETAAWVKDWYCQRGECSENRIKELKCGLGMERMPSGDEKANALFFRIGALAYNLLVLFKAEILPKSHQRFQVKTLRWRFYQVAGKITRHANAIYLKVNESAFEFFEQIRASIWRAQRPHASPG